MESRQCGSESGALAASNGLEEATGADTRQQMPQVPSTLGSGLLKGRDVNELADLL